MIRLTYHWLVFKWDILQRLARIETLLILQNRILTDLSKGNTIIMADLTSLSTAVANTTTVEQSAIVLIKGLAAQLAAAGTDPVKLQALQDSLTSGANDLAAAVAANTPSGPPPPPAGPPA